ncbi:MAG: secretin N-terminal domain-containing protein [Verrucomicrobiota bacterium]
MATALQAQTPPASGGSPDESELTLGIDGQSRADALQTVGDLLGLDVDLPTTMAMQETINLPSEARTATETIDAILADSSHAFALTEDGRLEVFPVSDAGTPRRTAVSPEADTGMSEPVMTPDEEAMTPPAPEDIPAVTVPDAPTPGITTQLPQTAAPEFSAQKEREELISVDFPDAEIRTIIRQVADLYELNVVIPDTLVGNTSIKLRNVTWRDVFDVVLEQVGFTYVEERNIIKIKSQEELAAEPTTTRVFVIDYADAPELQNSLAPLVDPGVGGQIQVDRRANALLITERPSKMNGIQEVIERLDRPTEQVMIESKFIEVSDRDVENIGVNWASLNGWQVGVSDINRQWNRTDSTSRSFNTTEGTGDVSFDSEGSSVEGEGRGNTSGTLVDNLTGDTLVDARSTFDSDITQIENVTLSDVAQGRIDSAVFSADAFNVVLSALKSTTDVKLVSNPTVVTLNNEAALIAIGEKFPIPQYTYNDERGTFEVSGFEYEDIGINLEVTPQVNSAGFINMRLLPEVSSRQGTVNFGGASGAEIPIIASRRTESVITIKDGYTLTIGGLVESDTSNGQTKVPVLGDIPGIGRAFRNKSVNETSRNLVIFITARTLNPDGTTYRDIIDPRLMGQMGITPRDIPGYVVPEDEKANLMNLERAKMERSERQRINQLNQQNEALRAAREAELEAERKAAADEEPEHTPWWQER